MRLTCLKCGRQAELAFPAAAHQCACGIDFSRPNILYTGTRPDVRAAEKTRHQAFRTAGTVRSLGGASLGISLLGVLFFPFGLIGALVGLYCLIALPGAIGSMTGKRAALWGLVVGLSAFFVEGAIATRWWKERQQQKILQTQNSVVHDLRGLLRAQRLHRASGRRYAQFHEFRWEPLLGSYTFYLNTSDPVAGFRDGKSYVDPLPDGFYPGVSRGAFTAVAVANLDSDPMLDVWVLYDNGEVIMARNDFDDTIHHVPVPPAPEKKKPSRRARRPVPRDRLTPPPEALPEPPPPPPLVREARSSEMAPSSPALAVEDEPEARLQVKPPAPNVSEPTPTREAPDQSEAGGSDNTEVFADGQKQVSEGSTPDAAPPVDESVER